MWKTAKHYITLSATVNITHYNTYTQQKNNETQHISDNDDSRQVFIKKHHQLLKKAMKILQVLHPIFS